MSQLPPGLRARVLASTQALPPVSPRALVARRALSVLVPIVGLGGLVAIAPRPDVDAHNLPYFALASAVAALTAVTLGAVGLARGRGMLGAPAGSVLAAAIVGPIAVAIMAIVASVPGPGSMVFSHLSDALVTSMNCAAVALLVGGAVLGLLLYARSLVTTPSPRLVGACLGAASGAIGFLVEQLHCPAANVPHAVAGHWLPMVIIAGVGALVAPRALAP